MVPFVFFCCAIVCLALPVSSDADDLNMHLTAYMPGIVPDVWHVPDFLAIPKDGSFLNEIPQFHPSDWFASRFPMPYDIQSLLESTQSFSLRVMNSSWSEPANTNVFHKGEPLYLQVLASPAPDQQLYVQSCHVSSSPNPAEKPDISLIINKGCVASKESVVKFVFQQSDTVNMVIRTSSLKPSEIYLHCRVHLTNFGLTSVTKFCNYNKLKSRWVDLSGQTSICDCCGRRCRSLIKHGKLPELFAVVSTGPVIIKDQQSSNTTPSDNSAKSSPTTRNMHDKRWIMAGASFSGSSKQNDVSPWLVQPGYAGGVMAISQGMGGDLSMLLQNIMGLDGWSLMPQQKDYEALKPEENAEKNLPVVDEEEGNAEAVVWHDDDDDDDDVYVGIPVVTEVDHPEPRLNFESVFDLPLNDQSSVGSTPDELSDRAEDEGEAVFRQAEMVFKSNKETKLPEQVLYSKLSVNQAADGSSSVNYEEQKRPSFGKQDGKTTKLEKDGEKQKDEQKEVSFRIKDLVSALLEQLRGLWTVQ